MAELIAFLVEPWGLPFMRRAFAVALLSGVLCGVVGTHVVLRGMAFIGDAVAHASFPGVAVAFVLQGSLVLGGLVAGLAAALGVVLFARSRRLREDTVIGVFYAAAFALGVVVLSAQARYGGSLESFLFGQILAIDDRDVLVVAAAAVLVLAATAAVHKELVAVALDRESAAAAGLPLLALDLALYATVTLAVVVSLQAVGNILVLALLVTPAACARLLTDRLGVMLVLAPAVGAGGGVAGLYLSYGLGLPAGSTIVLTLTAVFVCCALAAPRHGWLARRAARAVTRPPAAPPSRGGSARFRRAGSTGR